MLTGVKALYLIAAVAYLAALWFTQREARTTA
jgi:hypothetical protein